jgi:hypothetical protein
MRCVALACCIVLSSVAAGLIAVAPGTALGAASAPLALTSVHVAGTKITISGRLHLRLDARARRQARIRLTLSAKQGRPERFNVRPNATAGFKVAYTTRLHGTLRLTVSLEIGGRSRGGGLSRSLHVTAPSGSGTSGTSGAQTPPVLSGSSPSGPPTSTPSSTPLDGTFDLTGGSDVAGTISGSWFEMFIPGGSAPLLNSNSPLANQYYTPLSPGSAAGLQTYAFEPAPSPAFSEVKEGKPVGNSLAGSIMVPQEFEGYDFGVVTQPSDPQSLAADPLPQVLDTSGQLSGQITAWAVGWNGQWFNQGSPKPDGTSPGGTTALSGTYDPASGHYVLEWKSLIVGGPFNNFLGDWHLEGTFVPSS